ncbi:LexA family protein [Flavobacterium cyanobacteriorum]|nr:translesion error-prone DNA polymerase V autoproteolytic subunit [Flavobacterium cyanobacteriorum]
MKDKTPALSFYTPAPGRGITAPFITALVPAGFASPAQDFMECRISLDETLCRNSETTFFIRVSGNSMVNAGIDDGDILVVDRSLEPADGKIAICLIDGDFTVKRLKTETGCVYLMPENPDYPALKVTEYNQFSVWGIVTYLIKKV